MSDTPTENVVIIGSGPAGYTAAIYAARADLAPILIDGSQPGGQLTITTDVDNYPGFPEGIMGPELMERFRGQAERFGTRFLQAEVRDIDTSAQPFRLTLDNGDEVVAKTVIIATGASARWLGIPSEKAYMGKGVSACATCDGFFYRDVPVVVVGGGDTALEEASFLTKFASKVYVVHRRDSLRASKIMQQHAMDNPKIEFVWNAQVDEVLGAADKGVTGVRLKSTVDESTQEIECHGVFMAIGHTPNTGFLNGKVELHDTGYIKLAKPGTTRTSVPGLFAAGDVADQEYRQAITAAGAGCQAALDAERYIQAQGHGG